MRDDWEKLSDENSSLRACRRRIPNRSRVVSCESRIVHMFYYLCLHSLHLLHRTLYRRTHILPLIIWFYSSFFCASNVHTTSVVPRLSTSATLTRLGKRQFRIFGQLEYNHNTIFVYTIQYNTIFGQFGMQQPDACTCAGLTNSTILKPSKWRHCDPEHCKKEMRMLKRA